MGNEWEGEQRFVCALTSNSSSTSSSLSIKGISSSGGGCCCSWEGSMLCGGWVGVGVGVRGFGKISSGQAERKFRRGTLLTNLLAPCTTLHVHPQTLPKPRHRGYQRLRFLSLVGCEGGWMIICEKVQCALSLSLSQLADTS